VEKPADPDRGPGAIRYARTSHVRKSPRYNRHRFRMAVRKSSNTNTRPYSATTSGARTIDSLHIIPNADATTAAVWPTSPPPGF
jgi:hypothetical protein